MVDSAKGCHCGRSRSNNRITKRTGPKKTTDHRRDDTGNGGKEEVETPEHRRC